MRKDKRIGKHAYLTPGIGIAGGNLERDLENILELINKNKIDRIHKKFFLNFKDLSKHMSLWIDRRIKDILKQKKIKNIGIFGLSYKENTNSTKNAKALNIIRKYSKKYKIFSYDPLVKIKSKKNFYQLKNKISVIKNSDMIIIMNKSKQFLFTEKQINKSKSCQFLIDPFQVLNKKKLQKKKFIFHFNKFIIF